MAADKLTVHVFGRRLHALRQTKERLRKFADNRRRHGDPTYADLIDSLINDHDRYERLIESGELRVGRPR